MGYDENGHCPMLVDGTWMEAVRSATSLLGELEPSFNATERTLAAIEIHGQFRPMDPDQEGCTPITADPDSVL